MKKYFFFLLIFVAFITQAQPLTRTTPLSNMIQYAPASTANAKSVVIILHGTGEQGSDLTIIENHIKVAAALKAGTFQPNRIILFPQLASSQGGWYANTIGPVIAYAQKFKLPIDFSGLSLGGMAVSNNLPSYPGVIRSAMTCPGKVEANIAAGPTWPAVDYVDAYRKVPSIHYYDPTDAKIDGGYTSIKNLVTNLQAEGKKDITLITHAGYPSAHNVWDYAYSPENYFAWLDALDSAVTPPPTVKDKHLWINDTIDVGVYKGPAIVKFELK